MAGVGVYEKVESTTIKHALTFFRETGKQFRSCFN